MSALESWLTLNWRKNTATRHLHIDLTAVSLNYTVRTLRPCMAGNSVRALNVAGPRGAIQEIYSATLKLLEKILIMRYSI